MPHVTLPRDLSQLAKLSQIPAPRPCASRSEVVASVPRSSHLLREAKNTSGTRAPRCRQRWKGFPEEAAEHSRMGSLGSTRAWRDSSRLRLPAASRDKDELVSLSGAAPSGGEDDRSAGCCGAQGTRSSSVLYVAPAGQTPTALLTGLAHGASRLS